MFTPLHEIAPKALRALGIKREADAALVCERYRKIAPRIVHHEILLHAFPKYFKGKTLTLGVISPSWWQVLYKHRQRLIDELNSSFGATVIEKITIQIAEAPKDMLKIN